MTMLFVLCKESSGLIYGYTTTDNEVPGAENPDYIAWNEFPCDPPFASMEDAELRVQDYVGMVLSDGVLYPPPPEPDVYSDSMSVLVFRDRFTLPEKTSIYAIADTDSTMRVILDDLNSATYVSILDQQTINGVDYMISVGAIEASRRDAILAPALQTMGEER